MTNSLTTSTSPSSNVIENTKSLKIFSKRILDSFDKDASSWHIVPHYCCDGKLLRFVSTKGDICVSIYCWPPLRELFDLFGLESFGLRFSVAETSIKIAQLNVPVSWLDQLRFNRWRIKYEKRHNKICKIQLREKLMELLEKNRL